MDKDTLSKLTKQIIERMVNEGYSKSSIIRYKTIYNQFVKYSVSCDINTFSETLADEYLDKKYGTHNYNKNPKLSAKIRPIIILKEFKKTGTYDITHQHEKYFVPQVYKNLIDEYWNYQQSLNLKEKTIKGKIHRVKMFLIYLKSIDICNSKGILSCHVYSYIKSLKYASQSITSITYTIRDFFNYLYNNSLSNINPKNLFPIIKKNNRNRILSYYNKDEINKILSVIDNSTKKGKRDYLILCLAIYLGIRSCDIINLKMENINFNTKTIEFIQIKTNALLQLPLLDNIKYALLDYLKNSRPNIESPYILITTKAPYKKYNHSFHKVITKYMDLARVDYNNKKHGLHSMRHSLVSNMLESKTPMPIITGILGHNNMNTTKMYAQIDVDSLRKMALEV